MSFLHEGVELELIHAARALKQFKFFVRQAWPHIDPAPLVAGWHLDAIADHLQAVSEGHIKKLIINIPPGFAKSLLVSVLWPAWNWARNPSWSVLGASYEQGLAVRDAVKARTLMRGEWFTKWFRSADKPFPGVDWDFAADADTKTYYRNTAHGERYALGVGGKSTGYRGRSLIIDDPLKATDARSKLARDKVITWYTEAMATRFNDIADAQQVIIMQRLHEDDLSGYLLRQGGWQNLRLPVKFEPHHRCKTRTWKGADFWQDPRTQEGELLFPKRFNEPILAGLKKSLGSFAFAGQYQQRPVPEEGGLFKRDWFNRRYVLPGSAKPGGLGGDVRVLPLRFDRIAIFTDAAFRKTEDSDKVAIGVFGLKGCDIYLLQLAWERMTFVETQHRLIDLKNRWPKASGIYVEAKANGDAVMNSLEKVLPGLIPLEPEGGKESRIAAVSPYVEAGNLFLPLQASWVEDYITEACAFPKAPHDDALDMTAYALAELLNQPQTVLDALAQLEGEQQEALAQGDGLARLLGG